MQLPRMRVETTAISASTTSTVGTNISRDELLLSRARMRDLLPLSYTTVGLEQIISEPMIFAIKHGTVWISFNTAIRKMGGPSGEWVYMERGTVQTGIPG